MKENSGIVYPTPKKRLCLVALLLFLLLFFVEQYVNMYHFFSVEQSRLFVWSWDYFLKEQLMQVGGLAGIINGFLIQFYLLPYCGAFITAGLITIVWVLLVLIFTKISSRGCFYICAFIPALSLIVLHSDSNYLSSGSIAFLLMLTAVYAYLQLASGSIRLLYNLIIIPVLFWWAGSVFTLYFLCILLVSILQPVYRMRIYHGLLIFLEICLLVVLAVRFSFVIDYKYAFLPDFYYTATILPGKIIYLPWVSFLLLFLFLHFLPDWEVKSNKWKLGIVLLQGVIIVVVTWQGILMSFDWESGYLKKMDYHTKKKQWDQIISSAKAAQNDYKLTSYVNMALAQKGELAEKAFHFQQVGGQGLVPPIEANDFVTKLLSDLYFLTGNLGMAQAMSFENCVINTPGNGSPRMLQRLIQTNLLYEAWAVAEKYIHILEKTLFYRDWANQQRRFLYAAHLLEKDPCLGRQYRNLIDEKHLSGPEDIKYDLSAIIRYNKDNRIAWEYLGAFTLLDRDIPGFNYFLTNYSTIEQKESLPQSFQEAALLFFEKNPELLSSFRIDDIIRKRYEAFKLFMNESLSDANSYRKLQSSFGDTYWYYFLITDMASF